MALCFLCAQPGTLHSRNGTARVPIATCLEWCFEHMTRQTVSCHVLEARANIKNCCEKTLTEFSYIRFLSMAIAKKIRAKDRIEVSNVLASVFLNLSHLVSATQGALENC